MNQKNNLKLNSSPLLVFIRTVGVCGIINTGMGIMGILPLIAKTFYLFKDSGNGSSDATGSKMSGMFHQSNLAPVELKERYAILDVLRGVALFGICLANFPEFSLYTFLGSEITGAMPTAKVDQIVRFLQYVFIDGKFYTLFSLLFGIGFSIIIANAEQNGKSGLRVFYRRMTILFIIGLLHLMFVWSGDILVLYALLGFLLPLFRTISNIRLLIWAFLFLLLPIAIDAMIAMFDVYPSALVVEAQQQLCAKYGITDTNFGYWLRDADTYTDVFSFLKQGALVRVQEFIEGNRLFKVMGLFLLGFYIGRNRLYANLVDKRGLLKRVLLYGTMVGLPASLLYAWSAVEGHVWGLTVHSVLYTVSVFPLGLAYASAICLLYLNHKENRVFGIVAASGRMALTNYIGQSFLGILIFYGIGFGWGASVGLIHVLMIATCVYAIEIILSNFWLHNCRFGPLEWMWRMLTYGKWFKLILRDKTIRSISMLGRHS